uniref:SMC hinge domain-containing protein n=1 Tax=Macrostomum lignano TaxID=282301 RepID=A0A1I8FBQ5_9PLAT
MKELVELKGDLWTHGGRGRPAAFGRRKEELHQERSGRCKSKTCALSLVTNNEVVKNYHGTLIELFDVDDTFYTCVEVTAGTRLFYHVVGHDRHVIQILKQIDKKKLPGDINFFPMNRIEVSQEPGRRLDDVQDRIQAQFRNVLEHVFGKTLICRSHLEVATRLARQQRFDCILLEGDQLSWSCKKNKQKTERRVKELEQRKETNRLRKEELDKEVNSKINELEKRRNCQIKRTKEWKLGSLKHELEQMKSTRESYQAELGSDLLSQLSVEEQREVDSLNDRIQELTREAKQLYNARIRLENEKTTIENQLHHNLLRRVGNRLETQLDEVAAETVKERLTEAEEELAEIENRVAAFQREMQSEEDRIARFAKQLFKSLERANREIKNYAHVSKYFKEIFSKLVPEGVAELVMQKGDAPAADDSGEPRDIRRMQRFVGIGIRVSFTAKRPT